MCFKIDAKNLCWINSSPDDSKDLCLHGHAIACIGNETLEYDATVSATALYLLKSLTQNHIMHAEIQMLPCCGFFLMPDENMENVTISGCPNGIDWSVIHEKNDVRLILENGKETIVPLHAYEQQVFQFADKIEAFYESCSPKIMPKDSYDRDSYLTFWNEWHRRRQER